MIRRAAAAVIRNAPLFAVAVALVIAFSWPWCLRWGNAFLDHIDPPFHAWKMEYMARKILAGDIFLAGGNTNMLYPNSGALYFEALQYPASLAAAPLLALGMSPEFAYHVILVLFWALAAPCVCFLLRELECSPSVAVVGAMVFTILPLRFRYMVALQMELVFALPLFYAFAIRFFRRPNACDAVLAALSWWLLAISELNEAVFAGLTAPFIALAFLSAKPRMALSRGFWLSALAGALAGAVSLCCLCLPYLEQHSEGAVDRDLSEIIKNSGQPFAYLLPWGRFQPWSLPNACHDELCVYPTLALLVLAAVACVLWLRRSSCPAALHGRASSARFRSVLRWTALIIQIAAPLSCIIYAASLIPCQMEWCEWGGGCKTVFRISSNIAAILAFALSLAPRHGESARTSFLRGFASAAMLSCLLSFGPLVKMGSPYNPLMTQSNHFYMTALKLIPMLSSFRTVSRFGILVVFFVFCAAFCALDSLVRRATKGGCTRKWLPAAISAAVFAACAIECVPTKKWNASRRGIDHPRESPAMARLFAAHPIRTFAGIPMGKKSMEGMRMFSLVKGDFPYVYAWCGYFPPYSRDICDSICRLERDRFHEHVASLYPPCLVFIDHDWISGRSRNPAGAPEDSISVLPNGSRFFDIDKWMSHIAERIDADKRFSIWEPKPLPPSSVAVRRFRTDIAALNPMLAAEVSTDPGTEVVLQLNGKNILTAVADASGTAIFSLNLETVEKRLWSRSAPNELAFSASEEASNGAEVQLRKFTMLDRDGNYRDPCAPYTIKATPLPPDSPYRPATP